jgi:hypothetical protein
MTYSKLMLFLLITTLIAFSLQVFVVGSLTAVIATFVIQMLVQNTGLYLYIRRTFG